jgi:hypothetical protein
MAILVYWNKLHRVGIRIFNFAMDAAVNPPVRIHAIKSTEASAKTVQRSIDSFLVDFQSRCTPAKGGNTTITAQLQKLSDALHEERERRKKRQSIGSGMQVSVSASEQ